jgi:hypothetical protein
MMTKVSLEWLFRRRYRHGERLAAVRAKAANGHAAAAR